MSSHLLKYMLQAGKPRAAKPYSMPPSWPDPFSYRLQVHVNGEKQERTVDLAETFNFLLGLNVRKREVYADKGRRYLSISRAKPGRARHKVAVIWRETDGLDRRRLRARPGFCCPEMTSQETLILST